MDKPKDLPTASKINNEHQPAAKARHKRAKLTRRHFIILILIITAVVLLAGYFAQTRASKFNELYGDKYGGNWVDKSRPEIWAKPIELPGLPNLYKVSDDLYRGAQPTAEGVQQLKKLGVRTIVNLRLFDFDRDKIKGTGLAYQHIRFMTWYPQDKKVIRFLKIVTDPNNTPVFLHCQRGADRTGAMCAIYRVAVQGWLKTEAIDEMVNGGFAFNRGWMNLIEYIEELDIEDIKRGVGATE
jgi:protein tyrosine phosphatase (PTP) superfamily phosphohydrolase (DUF442 family)